MAPPWVHESSRRDGRSRRWRDSVGLVHGCQGVLDAPPSSTKTCGRSRMKCPRCQQANPPQAKFCLECATPVSAAGSAPRPSPESYTPKHLAEKILTSRSTLEGERKQVTVLFADLKESMELLAERDPEEARQLLDPVLDRMMAAVHQYESTVNQVMGDGIMALFGAPLAHEDHAVRACYAALRMQAAVQQYATEVQRSHGMPIHMRVGLNAGARRRRCTSLASSRRTPTPLMSSRPKLTIARPSPWPKSWACARC